MKISQKNMFLGGLLLCGLCLPQIAFAIQGCSNASLIGTYNAQITNANLLNTLQNLNASAGTSGTTTTGTTGSTTGVTTSTTTGIGGFGGNPNSITGNTPALGRYYFDGTGKILGMAAPSSTGTTAIPQIMIIGSYIINADCTATLKLNTGQTYDAVLVSGSNRVLFLETDANGAGATGTLDHAPSACTQSTSPSSLGFTLSGATPASTGTTGGTTGSTTGTAVAAKAYSAIGVLNLDGIKNFTMTESVIQNGAVQRSTAFGTYSLGSDCALRLSFASGTNVGSTGAFVPPASINGLVVNSNNGLLTVAPSQSVIAVGEFMGQ